MKRLILFLLLIPVLELYGFDWADDQWDTNDKGFHYFGSWAITNVFRDFGASRKVSVFSVAFLGVCKEFADGSGAFPDNSLFGSTERRASWRDMVMNISGSATSIIVSDVIIPKIKKAVCPKKQKYSLPEELRLSFIQID